MFRFTRHFLTLFLLVTLLPNILLFIIGSQVMQHVMGSHEEQIINLLAKDTQLKWQNSLTKKNNETEKKVALLYKYHIPFKDYANILESSQVSIKPLRSSIANVKTWSEFNVDATSHLITTTYVPLISSQQLIQVTRMLNLDELKPHGPITLEIYKGKIVRSQNRVARLSDVPPKSVQNFFKKPGGQFPFMPAPASMSPDDTSEKSTRFILTDPHNNQSLTFVIKMHRPNHSPMNMVLIPLAILVVSGLVMSVIIAGIARKKIIQPLELLTVALEKASRGRFAEAKITCPETRSNFDIPPVIEQFNVMVGELEEKEILRQNFISNLTHDLRTPLLAEERVLEIFLRHFKTTQNTDLITLSEGLLKNTSYLIDMVNQLLETYEYEETSQQLNIEPVNLQNLTDQVLSQIEGLLSERNIQIRKQYIETPVIINADAPAIKRVFVNLLGNAVENIPKSSVLTVTLHQTETHAEIHFIDNGSGIDEKKIAHLFDRYTGGKGNTRKIGTGLGLYICKTIIEAHGGQISVESKPHEFTDFKIVLPKNQSIEPIGVKHDNTTVN